MCAYHLRKKSLNKYSNNKDLNKNTQNKLKQQNNKKDRYMSCVLSEILVVLNLSTQIVHSIFLEIL